MSEMVDNEELRQLYEADQADRGNGPVPPADVWTRIAERDEVRRARLRILIDDGALQTGADHFHAAMLFQHSTAVVDYWRAHELALRAVELGDRRGRWLAAAAFDRWLVAQGKPQKYGTQYAQVDGKFALSEVDSATSDEQRAEWDVPPLRVALQRASELTAGSTSLNSFLEDPPVRSLEVPGLRVDIKRWLGPPPPSDWPKSQPQPLHADDDVPDDVLPPGLTACRLPAGFGATDSSGEVVVNWWTQPLSDGALVVASFDATETPELEPVLVHGRQGIWIGATPRMSPMLVLPVDGTECWGIGGKLDRDLLVSLAATLTKPRT